IEAARTMLADAKLPVTFWAEAVNTAFYVQNKVLVNKSHNKTPYELFNGRSPTIGFLKPFGCHVMILNTLDNLGKFEEKKDEGYFIGYSMSSKAFRVFNKRTKRVKENLRVEFLENKAIEKGTKVAARQEVKKDVSSLRYIALPNWAHDALLELSSSQPQDHCNTKVPKGSGNSNPTASTSNPLADQIETLTVETPIPTVSSLVPTAYTNDSQEPSSDARLISKRVANQAETPSLDNILSLTNQFEDILGGTTNSNELNGEEVDISNMETTITASPTPTLRIHKDHTKSQIIGPVDTPIQTRNKFKEMDVKSAFLYGTIDEEVYVMQAPRFQDPECPAKVYKVEKAMYGLHQAPRSLSMPCEALSREYSTSILRLLHTAKTFDLVWIWLGGDYGNVFLMGFDGIQWFCNGESWLKDLLEFLSFEALWCLTIDARLHTAKTFDLVWIWLGGDYGNVFLMGFNGIQWIETTEEGTKILATVDGIVRIVSESSLRRNLKLRDEEGISSLPDAELFENLTLMEYNISPNQKFTFQKRQFSHQWKYLIHTIMQCLSLRSTSSNIATALVCLATNRTYNFSKMIFDGLVKNVNKKVSKFLMYLRFLTMCLRMSQFGQITHTQTYVVPFHTKKLFTTLRVNSPSFSSRIVPLFDGMLVHQGKGSGTPTVPHHTPSPEAQTPSHTTHPTSSLPPVTTTSIRTVTPTETTPIRHYTRRIRIAQSSVHPTVADEPASPHRDVIQGEACPTDSDFIADQDRATIGKSSTLPYDSAPRVTSLAAVEGSMQHTILELTALCTSLQRQLSELTDKFQAQEGRSMDEGEAVTERVSDDTEEIATVLTSMDATTFLASRVVNVPTGSGSIPTASTPAEGSVPTGSEEVPTASSVFATATVVTPVTRRKGKERRAEQIARDAEIVRIHAEEELQSMIEGLDSNNETVAKYLEEYHFKGMTFEEVEAKFNSVYKQMEDFMPMGSKEEAERIKRKGINLEEESAKKPKSSKEIIEEVKSLEELPEEKVKEMMQLVPIEEVSACYQFFIDLLKHLDKEDLNQLWRSVKETLSTRPPTNWKLYDSCGVHHVASKDKEIFMLVEKDYPLRKGLALVMICYKLQVDNFSQMANDLVLKIYKIANSPRQQVIKFPLAEEVPTVSIKGCHCQKKCEATARKIALLC
nr:retrovirus-related Pol polyprotein from transposon TNT 1-94 [Tanacetum cinerariifolium]